MSVHAIGRGRNCIVRIDKPAPRGIIVPALKVVESGFLDTGLAVRAKSREI